jgi:hypothetical protein
MLSTGRYDKQPRKALKQVEQGNSIRQQGTTQRFETLSITLNPHLSS